VKAVTADAYRLFHSGALALSRVEEAGMRIDVDRLDRNIQICQQKIDQTIRDLHGSDEWKQWKEHYSSKASLGSRTQLAYVLFELLGHKGGDKTASGNRYKADVANLEKLDIPFVRKFLALEKLKN